MFRRFKKQKDSFDDDLEIEYEKRAGAPSGLMLSSTQGMAPMLHSTRLASYEEGSGDESWNNRPLALRINQSGPVRDKDKARIIAETLEKEDNLDADGYESLRADASQYRAKRSKPRGREKRSDHRGKDEVSPRLNAKQKQKRDHEKGKRQSPSSRAIACCLVQ